MKRLKKQKQQILQYTAVFEFNKKENGYTVTVPALPGCISEGSTFEEALENISEAVHLYLEVMHKKRKSLPREEHLIVAPIRVTM